MASFVLFPDKVFRKNSASFAILFRNMVISVYMPEREKTGAKKAGRRKNGQSGIGWRSRAERDRMTEPAEKDWGGSLGE